MNWIKKVSEILHWLAFHRNGTNLTICSCCFLMWHQHIGKLMKLWSTNYPVQIPKGNTKTQASSKFKGVPLYLISLLSVSKSLLRLSPVEIEKMFCSVSMVNVILAFSMLKVWLVANSTALHKNMANIKLTSSLKFHMQEGVDSVHLWISLPAFLISVDLYNTCKLLPLQYSLKNSTTTQDQVKKLCLHRLVTTKLSN